MSTGGGGPSTSNTNSATATTPSSSTRSRMLLLSQTPSTPVASSTLSTPTTAPKNLQNSFPLVDEKLFSRYSSTLSAETNRRKTEIADHNKRLVELRKEAEMLEHTDWMYEPVDKLLGK